MRKTYVKPEVEVVDFETEAVMAAYGNKEEFISGLPEGWE